MNATDPTGMFLETEAGKRLITKLGAAGAMSQADSPYPGPADVVAVGIVVVAVADLITGGGQPESAFRNPRSVGPSVNVDTNVLINSIEKSGSPAGVAADSALAGRHPFVSPQAIQEFTAGGGSALQLAGWLRLRDGGLTPPPDRGTVSAMMQLGLKQPDAEVVAAGLGIGLKTLTSDFKTLAKKVPTVTELYTVPNPSQTEESE
jgi:hypothetical protein